MQNLGSTGSRGRHLAAQRLAEPHPWHLRGPPDGEWAGREAAWAATWRAGGAGRTKNEALWLAAVQTEARARHTKVAEVLLAKGSQPPCPLKS